MILDISFKVFYVDEINIKINGLQVKQIALNNAADLICLADGLEGRKA